MKVPHNRPSPQNYDPLRVHESFEAKELLELTCENDQKASDQFK